MLFNSKTLTIASAILGVLGSFYLSYSFLGQRNGILRRLLVGLPVGGVAFGITAFTLKQVNLLAISIGIGATVLGVVFYQPIRKFGRRYYSNRYSKEPLIEGVQLTPKQIRQVVIRSLYISLIQIFALFGTNLLATSVSNIVAEGPAVVFSNLLSLLPFFIRFLIVALVVSATFALAVVGDDLGEGVLGSIGAFCTLFAFAIQLYQGITL